MFDMYEEQLAWLGQVQHDNQHQEPINKISLHDDQHQEPIKKPEDDAISAKMKKFTLKMNFEIDKINQANRSIGANTLYSPNKGNSYFLIDIDKIDNDKPWIIYTNN